MRRKLAFVLRLLLGVVFVYAAWTKLRLPWLVFAMSIDSYQLLPPWLVLTVARTLPWVELAIGLLLLAGRWLRYAAPIVTLILLAFNAAMLRAYVVGSAIDCGCFGVGEAISAATLVRDGGLLACSLLLCFLVVRRADVPRVTPS